LNGITISGHLTPIASQTRLCQKIKEGGDLASVAKTLTTLMLDIMASSAK
jgi:hypothetical protein